MEFDELLLVRGTVHNSKQRYNYFLTMAPCLLIWLGHQFLTPKECTSQYPRFLMRFWAFKGFLLLLPSLLTKSVAYIPSPPLRWVSDPREWGGITGSCSHAGLLKIIAYPATHYILLLFVPDAVTRETTLQVFNVVFRVSAHSLRVLFANAMFLSTLLKGKINHHWNRHNEDECLGFFFLLG